MSLSDERDETNEWDWGRDGNKTWLSLEVGMRMGI